jgi:hypothetical protein
VFADARIVENILTLSNFSVSVSCIAAIKCLDVRHAHIDHINQRAGEPEILQSTLGMDHAHHAPDMDFHCRRVICNALCSQS